MIVVKIAGVILVVISAAGIGCTLFSFGIWPFETASLWIPFYVVLAFAGSCGCALSRNYRWSALGALCAAMALALMTPHCLPASRSGLQGKKASLRLLQANVYYPGNEPSYLLDLIHENRPDIVLLQEVTEKWKAFLKPLEDVYAFHHYSPRYPNGDIDLAQFWNRAGGHATALYETGIPATELTLTMNDRTVCLLNVHTAAPFTKGRSDRYQKQLGLLGHYVAAKKGPVAVAGDLNAGVWSRHYAQLVEAGGFVNARLGFGSLGTWPSFLPGPLRIALDHLLVSPCLKVVRCRTGRGIGSDHLPLITDLYVE